MSRILIFLLLIHLNGIIYGQWDEIPNGVPSTQLAWQETYEDFLRKRAADPDPHLPSGSRYNKVQSNFTSIANYPIMPFTPSVKSEVSSVLTNVSSIKIIDVRFDQKKVGFLPVNNDLQKKFNGVIGLNIDPSLINWLKKGYFENHLMLDTNSNRQLLVIVKKFWFSNDIVKPYTVSHPPLYTSLHFDLELYTSLDIGYYPQRKFSGVLTSLYDKGRSYSTLTDSFLHKLKNEILQTDFKIQEIEANWQSPIDFNDQYNNRMRLVKNLENRPPGLYNSFEELLSGSPITDSVNITVEYNVLDNAPLYACQLNAFKNGVHYPINNAWGYFNGKSYFINTGNGFFVKLFRTNDQFIFYHLKNIQQDRIKKGILERISIGDNDYHMLRDYTKAFAFTYQLDLETGKLF